MFIKKHFLLSSRLTMFFLKKDFTKEMIIFKKKEKKLNI